MKPLNSIDGGEIKGLGGVRVCALVHTPFIGNDYSKKRVALSRRQKDKKYWEGSMSGHDWLSYIGFLANRISESEDADDKLQGIEDCFVAINALAADTTASPEDRRIACELQATLSSHARPHIGAAIAALAKIANSDAVEPEERDEARKYLKHVTERLREQGSDIGQWVQPETNRPQ
jgi:hypothetical protein